MIITCCTYTHLQAVKNVAQDTKEAVMGATMKLKDNVTGRPTVSERYLLIMQQGVGDVVCHLHSIHWFSLEHAVCDAVRGAVGISAQK